MNLSFYLEEKTKKLAVVYTGRFQPFHNGHLGAYKQLKEKFPNATVFIATSNPSDTKVFKTKKTYKDDNPFSFDQKKKMIAAAGVPEKNIVKMIGSGYGDKDIGELIQSKIGKDAVLVVAMGESDKGRLLRGKEDAYYVGEYDKFQEHLPMSEHGYVYVLKDVESNIGKGKLSASDIRSKIRSGDIEEIKGSVPDGVYKFLQENAI